LLDADALLARAIALEDAGRTEDALEHYRRLLEQAPGHADAWHNRGLLLARLGRLAEAEQSHRRYIAAVPQSTRARADLVDVLLALGRYDAAIEALDWVIRRSPDDAGALVRRGVALACLRRFREAREVFALARRKHPDEVVRFVERVAPGSDLDTMLSPGNIFLSRGYIALEQCDWSGWDNYVTEMRKAAGTPAVVLEPAVAFMAMHLPLSGIERHSLARAIAARIESRMPTLPPPGPRQRTTIRIGLLSPDFREHLKAYAVLPLFQLLDRSRFELYAYSLSADDGSAIRAQLRSSADRFRDLHALPDREAAIAIRNDDIDILIDAAGHMSGGRFAIMAQRPARVQATLPGFPGSLGSNRLDYAIVDRVVASADAEWTERLAYLPHTFYLYDFRTPVPEVSLSRADYGLPDDAFVYCAFHKAEKITPDSFDLWMKILLRVPRAVLWFGGLSSAANRNLRTEAAARGVDPSRLVFAPFEPRYERNYLARQRLGDLMLDALYHNAITTGCDALGAGLPMLTMRGTAMASRAGESLLRAAGLPELVAADREEFVSRAIELASDDRQLEELRSRLVRNRSLAPLFDTARRVAELEAAFTDAMRGLLPAAG
jgi:tetratricopeptide (TPR) repeat protein